ncbi:MAG TPA: hypothetical protein VKQ07_07825 [Jatrophihabitantaceae bacterium]|nr:hypothetical protein [Jatrophihabitantaceae bacterium]
MTRYGNGSDEPMTTARIAGLSDAEELPSTDAPNGEAAAEPSGQAAADPALMREHDALAAVSDRGMEARPHTGSDDDGDEHAKLLADDELQTVVSRWREIQAEFVDEPRRAVHDADALVADLMQRLAAMFAHEREELEARWSSGSAVDTEDLRQGLQRYRTFFERLLAA